MRRVPMIAGAVLLAAAAWATPPEPIDPRLVAFPGTSTSPTSAAAAGRAMADRWLGDEPFDNPAGRLAREVRVSPQFLRVSRQDLHADNVQFDEEGGFLDGAGAWVGVPLRGISLGLHIAQPILRRESNAFVRGERRGPVQPAVVETRSTVREWRGGLAVSCGSATLRFGAGAEWTRRQDEYLYHEESGSPDAGNRGVAFSGDGLGFQVGLRWEPVVERGGLALGVAGRLVPALRLEGDRQAFSLLRHDSVAVSVRRESGWESGLSVRYGFGPAFRILAGAGFRTAMEWREFGVTAGLASQWSAAGEYHDPEEPWTVRLGAGLERQEGVQEKRSGLVALGFGWRWMNSGFELGVLRRGIVRRSLPTAFDDRVVGTFSFGW